MKTAVLPSAVKSTTPAAPSRWADYLAITRPRISVLVLFTVGSGGLYAGLPTSAPWLLILNAVLGTALVASGASAINQWLERDTDALMLRTRKRPLPAGRVTLAEAFVFGLVLALLGAVYLLATMPTTLPAVLAAFTFASYIAVYTPLKRVTTLNTVIGAVPGAMPPLIGYAAVRGELSGEAWVLFAILFVWQIPHFLAIAWMYRDDYARAGLRMLPVADPQGAVTARQMVLYCLALLVTGLMPVMVGGAGWLYGLGSTLLAMYFLRSAVAFARQRDDALAKKAMRASLVYLPLVLLLLVLDRWING
ncbi:MAG: heme o synthase [Gemmataceae bacterium]